MKIGGISKLAALAIGTSSLLSSGCISMPLPVKVALTPLAITRDVIDMPLSAAASCADHFSNTYDKRSDGDLKKTMFRYSGFKRNESFNLCEFSAELTTDIIGSIDYLTCRSFAPFPKGTSPWEEKDDSWDKLFFPNLKAIWALPTYENPFTGKIKRLD